MGRGCRTPGSGAGKLKGDLFNSLDFLFECKNEKQVNFLPNVDQSKRQAEQGNWAREKWALIVRDPRKPEFEEVYAVIDLWQFLELLKRNKEPIIKEPDKQVTWHLNNLKNAIHQVLKDLE